VWKLDITVAIECLPVLPRHDLVLGGSKMMNNKIYTHHHHQRHITKTHRTWLNICRVQPSLKNCKGCHEMLLPNPRTRQDFFPCPISASSMSKNEKLEKWLYKSILNWNFNAFQLEFFLFSKGFPYFGIYSFLLVRLLSRGDDVLPYFIRVRMEILDGWVVLGFLFCLKGKGLVLYASTKKITTI